MNRNLISVEFSVHQLQWHDRKNTMLLFKYQKTFLKVVIPVLSDIDVVSSKDDETCQRIGNPEKNNGKKPPNNSNILVQ